MISMDLILNLTLLVSLSILSSFIEKRWSRLSRCGGILQGVLFGGAAVLGMLHPLDLGSGVIIDGRSVMISLCAFFFGPWATIIAGAMAILCRFELGGAGTVTGILVILSSVGIGLWAHYKLHPENKPPSLSTLYLFGLAVHIAMIALLFLTLPGGIGLAVVKRIGLPVLLYYPLATILVGRILSSLLEEGRYIKELRESTDFIHLLLDSTAEGIYGLDPQGNCIFCNKKCLQFLKYERPEDLIGQNMHQLVHHTHDDGSPYDSKDCLIHQVMNQGQEIHVDSEVAWRADGTSFPYEYWAYPVLQDGKVISTVVTFLDITERKCTETYKNMGREILELSIEQMGGEDLIQKILSVVKANTGVDAVGIRLKAGEDFPYFLQSGFAADFLLKENTLLERNADDEVCRDEKGNVSLECTCGLVLTGKVDPADPFFTPNGSFWTNDSFPLLELPEADDPRHHPRNQCIHQGYGSVALAPIRNKDGIVGLLQLNFRKKGAFSLVAIEFLEVIAGYIGAVMMRKQAEEALLQRTRELEERSAELVRFNYTVSHDLKSPLVTVQSFLGFLELDLAAKDVERIGKDIDYIRSAAKRMGQLLDELLEISQVGRGSTSAVEVPFQNIAQEVLSLLAGPIVADGVTIKVDETDIVLVGDRMRLLEIWQNLVENAVKYMGDQPQPLVTIGSEKQGDEVIFFVRDNGIGIDPRYTEKVFDLFEQLDKKVEGSGLGLALVKRIVELYNGRIWVESAGEGQGSCFRFTLPAALRQGVIG